MGKPPAVIIIARHGARLDAADKNWHLTSATPYDPPLTYGGWLQSRSLGNRIASILGKRERACKNQSNTPGDSHHETSPNNDILWEPSKTRKYEIIIHSSPFLRCVQTAVAISAGIGQFQKTAVADAYRSHPVLHSGLPQVRATKDSPQLSAIPEPEHLRIIPPKHSDSLSSTHRIAQLRIDAFLGEWLSPDYFENMTPPPSSILMVACAKAELLRPAPEIANVTTSIKSSMGHFPGGWSRDRSPASSADEDEQTGLAHMAALSHSLPRRVHTIHLGDGTRMGVRHKPQDTPPAASASDGEQLTYIPPTPMYAISNSDSIPAGYVAHALNACVDVKYQWDSMRPPQDWGNGGEYGEEWSDMHKRFRTGLQRMITWYKEHGTSISAPDGSKEEDEDSDADTILILVTHGAGCNALIGALTNQPVLLDVGMASLTMAVRKSEAGNVDATPLQSPKRGRRGSIDLGIAHEYTVELTASTEHLRAASNPLGMPSPRGDGPLFGAYRRSSGSPFLEIPDSSSVRSGLEAGLHRSASGSQGLRPYPLTSRPKISSGLWGSETASVSGGVGESSDSDSMPNFGGATALRNNQGQLRKATGGDTTPPQGSSVQRGLWPGRFDSSVKRRWTSTDR